MPGLLDGVTRLGSCCVFLPTRSEQRLLPSIYPSLLRDGVSLWVECGFPPTRSERSFLWITGRYSFRMGSPFSGQILTIWSWLKELLQLGSWECFFGPSSGCFFFLVILGSSGWLWSLGEFPHSVVFTSGADSVCIPLANEGVGLGPSPAGPVASHPPSWVDLLRQSSGVSFTRAFSCAGIPRMGAR